MGYAIVQRAPISNTPVFPWYQVTADHFTFKTISQLMPTENEYPFIASVHSQRTRKEQPITVRLSDMRRLAASK